MAGFCWWSNGSSSVIHTHTAWAYESLRQSDWSGGYGQQVWSDSTKFNEYYHVNYGEELTIPGNDTWYDSAYKYRKRIEIDNSEQGELDHFPVLVVLDHKVNIDYLKTQSSAGNDIRFTDEDGKTIIPHDIEFWNQGGKSYIWVKIPQIKDHQKDYFYMYYGNPDAIGAGDPHHVWDNKFLHVWHLNEAPANNGLFIDSTQQRIQSTYYNPDGDGSSNIYGQMGRAVELDGDRDYIDNGDIQSVDGLTSITISMWIKLDLLNKSQSIIRKWRSSGQSLDLSFATSTQYWCINDEDQGGGGRCVQPSSSYDPTDIGKWIQVIGTWDVNSDIKIYINGNYPSQSIFRTNEISEIDANDEHLAFGARYNNGSPDIRYQGSLDEVRISSVARSDQWIRAEYKSETNTYLTFGNEELFGSELLSSIFDAEKGMSWGYLSYEAEEPEKTAAKVKVRTGNNMYLADAPDFEVCESITNKTDISLNKCVRDGDRYIQYQVILESTEVNKTPIFKEISITDFLAHPVVKGISTVATPHPSTPSSLRTSDAQRPRPAPRPSPSPMQNSGFLQPIWDFLEALIR